MTLECPADLLTDLVTVAVESDERGLAQADVLLRDYANDARLHFLRGSLLASLKRYSEAKAAMQAAIDMAPDFAIARFQLGFLQMTSGDGVGAEATWRRLLNLDEDDALRLFAEGLRHVIHDESTAAVGLLERGIALNQHHLPLSNDMRLIINEIRSKAALDEAPASSAQMLLNQSVRRPTKH